MSDTAPAPAKTQFRLYARMVPALGLIAIISSFAEADQRGLLFKANDFALLAEEAALAVPNGTPGAFYLGGPQFRDSGARQRNIPGRPATRVASAPLLGAAEDPASPAAGGAGQNAENGAVPTQAAPTFAAAIPTTSPTVSRGQAAPGPGFPDSPIGLIAVSTGAPGPVDPGPGPVVPAIPEPASWLLMILGIGWLGLSLRRQKDGAGSFGKGLSATA